MLLAEHTATTLDENLAIDESLLLAAEDGGSEVLRLWEVPTYAVVLGAGGVLADDIDEPACRSDDVPLGRRASGGGTVLLGPGCLVYSLVLSYDRAPGLRDIGKSVRWILPRIVAALTPFAAGITLEGDSDLTLAGRKFAGHAQQRKRRFFLHHGTLLYDFDLTRVGRYLREPPKQPAYRASRPHADFVTNLPAPGAALRTALAAAWGAHEPADLPLDVARKLVTEKYADPVWVRRR
ncbi:MAG: lipoate--protein ligase family protein [Gemmataceae bacterium]